MTIDEMKEKKREFGYSFKKLSELSGVPLGTIQKIFNGETKSPRYDTIKMLQKVLMPENSVLSVDSNRQSRDYGKDEYRFKTYTEYTTDNNEEKTRELREEPAIIYGSGKKVDLEHFNGKEQGEYTLEDYEALPDDVRVELIDGHFYYMEAPTTLHQLIASELHFYIRNYIRKNKGECIPFLAPTDVQLDRDDKTILEPDVFIVCDPKKITEKRIYGNPDFVAEVLSPSTSKKDRFIKAKKYKYAGVKEYWLIDPKRKNVITYTFDENDDDNIAIYSFEDRVPIALYNGKLSIDFAEIAGYVDSVCGV